MVDASSNDENPYASPAYTCPPGVGPDGRFYSTRAPADAIDILINAFYALYLGVMTLGVPILLAVLASWRILAPNWPVLILPIAVLLTTLPAIVWLIWFSRTIVVSAAIDEEGIHFLRMFSRPDDWPWERITSVRPAARWEVVWDGLLRPLLFPRERSNCSSLLGHYRIQGKTDYCFFPPKNPQAFVEAIARYQPDLLPQ